MSSKSSPGKGRRQPKPSHVRFFHVSWFLQLLFILFLAVAGYVIWLDFRIHSEFEGKRWLLPARVYARPLEIYPGQELSPELLKHELDQSGYQSVSALRQAGQYMSASGRVEFIKRSFHYWDGKEPQMHLRVDFEDGRIVQIRERPADRTIGLARLEPRLIGKIYPEHNEDRVLIPYEEVPQFLVDALIAVEDRHYFAHDGLDMRGIARAIITNIRQAELAQGGSTLTQQLVKNFFLTDERTLWRKFNEAIMALLLEWRYSKAEILSAYINEIYLGQNGARGIHGFGTAAEFYFAKPLNELQTEQLALLIGLVRGASYYDPRRHPERALKR